MTPQRVFQVFLLLALVWTVIWTFVVLGSRRAVPYEQVGPRAARLRRVLLLFALPVAVLLFVLSLRSLPYLSARTAALGAPEDVVTVESFQWGWTLSKAEVRAAVPIEFAVTARDVNHGFGLYAPDGRLVAQVQAMPGYTNRLVYRFDSAGVYTVRCLEYCGVAHHAMLAAITVRDH